MSSLPPPSSSSAAHHYLPRGPGAPPPPAHPGQYVMYHPGPHHNIIMYPPPRGGGPCHPYDQAAHQRQQYEAQRQQQHEAQQQASQPRVNGRSIEHVHVAPSPSSSSAVGHSRSQFYVLGSPSDAARRVGGAADQLPRGGLAAVHPGGRRVAAAVHPGQPRGVMMTHHMHHPASHPHASRQQQQQHPTVVAAPGPVPPRGGPPAGPPPPPGVAAAVGGGGGHRRTVSGDRQASYAPPPAYAAPPAHHAPHAPTYAPQSSSQYAPPTREQVHAQAEYHHHQHLQRCSNQIPPSNHPHGDVPRPSPSSSSSTTSSSSSDIHHRSDFNTSVMKEAELEHVRKLKAVASGESGGYGDNNREPIQERSSVQRLVHHARRAVVARKGGGNNPCKNSSNNNNNREHIQEFRVKKMVGRRVFERMKRENGGGGEAVVEAVVEIEGETIDNADNIQERKDEDDNTKPKNKSKRDDDEPKHDAHKSKDDRPKPKQDNLNKSKPPTELPKQDDMYENALLLASLACSVPTKVKKEVGEDEEKKMESNDNIRRLQEQGSYKTPENSPPPSSKKEVRLIEIAEEQAKVSPASNGSTHLSPKIYDNKIKNEDVARREQQQQQQQHRQPTSPSRMYQQQEHPAYNNMPSEEQHLSSPRRMYQVPRMPPAAHARGNHNEGNIREPKIVTPLSADRHFAEDGGRTLQHLHHADRVNEFPPRNHRLPPPPPPPPPPHVICEQGGGGGYFISMRPSPVYTPRSSPQYTGSPAPPPAAPERVMSSGDSPTAAAGAGAGNPWPEPIFRSTNTKMLREDDGGPHDNEDGPPHPHQRAGPWTYSYGPRQNTASMQRYAHHPNGALMVPPAQAYQGASPLYHQDHRYAYPPRYPHHLYPRIEGDMSRPLHHARPPSYPPALHPRPSAPLPCRAYLPPAAYHIPPPSHPPYVQFCDDKKRRVVNDRPATVNHEAPPRKVSLAAKEPSSHSKSTGARSEPAPADDSAEALSYPPSSSPSDEKIIITKGHKWAWKDYPELEAFLVANRQEYLRHSAMRYTSEQREFNNRLTERLLTVADRHNYIFDRNDFDFVSIRDRIRCYYKSYVQSNKKRGVIVSYPPLRPKKMAKKVESEQAAPVMNTVGEGK